VNLIARAEGWTCGVRNQPTKRLKRGRPPRIIAPMSETIVNLRINSVLLKDAAKIATEMEIEVERLIEEIVESFVATARLKKQVPLGAAFRTPRKQKVH